MRSPLVWSSPLPAVGQILIEAEPLACIDAYQQDETSKPEAGGILLGYRRGLHLHIAVATVPQLADQRRRYFFKRSDKVHQQVALARWRSSGQTMDYIGDWHTHPEQSPTPSGHDMAEWRKICDSRPHPMVFLILGWSGELWLGVSQGDNIAKCDHMEGAA